MIKCYVIIGFLFAFANSHSTKFPTTDVIDVSWPWGFLFVVTELKKILGSAERKTIEQINFEIDRVRK